MTWHAPHVLPAQAAAIDQQSAERRYWADVSRASVTIPVVDGWRGAKPLALKGEELVMALVTHSRLCEQCDHTQGRHTQLKNKCKTCGKRCRRAEPENDG